MCTICKNEGRAEIGILGSVMCSESVTVLLATQL